MTWWIIVIIVGFVLGIIVLSAHAPHKSKTRAEYLEGLSKFLEGQLTPLEGYEQGYKIQFNFEGLDFVFEDIEEEGFQEKVHKAFMKTKTQTNLTISFTEGARATIRSNIVKASEITDQPIEKLVIPKELKRFTIFTNNIEETNDLFANPRILRIFIHYANTGARGEPAMALKIQDGLIVLEFFSRVTMRPNLFDVMQSPAKIETELFHLIRLAKAVEGKLPEPN